MNDEAVCKSLLHYNFCTAMHCELNRMWRHVKLVLLKNMIAYISIERHLVICISVLSYIAPYTICSTTQSPYNSPPGRSIHSDTNSASLGRIQPCCNYYKKTIHSHNLAQSVHNLGTICAHSVQSGRTSVLLYLQVSAAGVRHLLMGTIGGHNRAIGGHTLIKYNLTSIHHSYLSADRRCCTNPPLKGLRVET